jgi:hypothetical protein
VNATFVFPELVAVAGILGRYVVVVVDTRLQDVVVLVDNALVVVVVLALHRQVQPLFDEMLLVPRLGPAIPSWRRSPYCSLMVEMICPWT